MPSIRPPTDSNYIAIHLKEFRDQALGYTEPAFPLQKLASLPASKKTCHRDRNTRPVNTRQPASSRLGRPDYLPAAIPALAVASLYSSLAKVQRSRSHTWTRRPRTLAKPEAIEAVSKSALVLGADLRDFDRCRDDRATSVGSTFS